MSNDFNDEPMQPGPDFDPYRNVKDWIGDTTYKEAEDVYWKLLSEGINPFDEMLKMQYYLQKEIANNKPGQHDVSQLNTLKEKFEWLRDNKMAMDDEFREVIDALPGTKTPIKERSALWKWWKEKHDVIGNRTFNDLTPDELDEIKFEFIDMLHFFMNLTFALDLSAKDLFVYYYIKNAENFKRANSCY